MKPYFAKFIPVEGEIKKEIIILITVLVKILYIFVEKIPLKI